MSHNDAPPVPGPIPRAVAYLRVFAVEVAALVLVLAWLFAGVPYVCSLFGGWAAPAFAAGCAVGLAAWIANRRLARRFSSALLSVLFKTLLLFLMGGLIFADALAFHHLEGAPLFLVAFASGALTAAGTATVFLAWCTALTPRAPRDVELVGMAALLANILLATFLAFVPGAYLGVVVACPILAWTLLVATRNEALSRESALLAAPAPQPSERSCAACRFARGPLPLLASIALAYLALGYLGELGSRGVESATTPLKLVEGILTCVFALVALVLFRAHAHRVDLPAALPWVTALVAAAQLLRAAGGAWPWPALCSSALFTAALALTVFSTLTLVTGGFGASPRCACTRVARPDVALAAVAGGYVVGATLANVSAFTMGPAAPFVLLGAIAILVAVSFYLGRHTRGAAAVHLP